MKKYMQITGGRGPVECARAVTLVAQAFLKDIGNQVAVELVDCEAHNQYEGCHMSMIFCIEAENIPASIISEWEGTIQWTATKNPYRPNHKRKNWFVGVHFFDEVELPDIKDADIRYETCRSSGKGGQNVNKVETAVRAIHIPSGISVKCSDERSQTFNKAKARQRLLLKLHQQAAAAKAAAQTSQWTRHDTLQRGNPTKTFTSPL